MRSRYAAYALGLVDYVIETTDPSGPQWNPDRTAWRQQVAAFCEGTRFRGLVVIESPAPSSTEGFVTFQATLERDGVDVSMSERSRFTRLDDRWWYHSGEPVPAADGAPHRR